MPPIEVRQSALAARTVGRVLRKLLQPRKGQRRRTPYSTRDLRGASGYIVDQLGKRIADSSANATS